MHPPFALHNFQLLLTKNISALIIVATQKFLITALSQLVIFVTDEAIGHKVAFYDRALLNNAF